MTVRLIHLRGLVVRRLTSVCDVPGTLSILSHASVAALAVGFKSELQRSRPTLQVGAET
jgi:hypothetical protein